MVTILLAIIGCGHGPDDPTTDSGLPGDDSDGGTDSTAAPDACEDPGAWSTSIHGTVTVELWIEADGEREETSFEDSFDGDFPFGGIWVSAYTEDDDGDLVYLDETVIKYPSTAGDSYSLSTPYD